jgi:Domain of unknown function (DUF4159)
VHRPRTNRAVAAAAVALVLASVGAAAASMRSRASSGASRADFAVSPDGRQHPRAVRPNTFYFTRGIYSGWGRGFGRRGGGGSWATDWPKSDRTFLTVLRRLTDVDAFPQEHGVALDDPALKRFPFLYILEVGRMGLTPPEAKGLREYMLSGGFVMVDDFWGTYEWANFQEQMSSVFPEYPIVEIPLDHQIFSTFYDIDSIVQVPNVNNAMTGRTWEQDGYVPHVRGMFDDKNHLMMVINWNTDLGDAWEWAESPYYPVNYSTYAFKVGVNTIIYAMSH